MDISRILVISLDPEQAFNRTWEKLDVMRWPEQRHFEIMQAFNGHEDRVPEGYNIYPNWQLDANHPHAWNDWWTRPILPGEIGCAVSHRMIWEKIVKEGNDNVLVLEDDFVFSGNGSVGDIQLPEGDWDIAWLGRDAIGGTEHDTPIEGHPDWVIPQHLYRTHAYIIRTPEVAKRLLSSGLKQNLIPVDEYMSALGCAHRRDDIRQLFPPSLKFIATKDPYYIAQDRPLEESTVENTMEKQVQPEPQVEVEQEPYFEILDTSNWEEWKEKYINLSMSKHEFELMVTDRGDNVFEFPLFTPKFCREAVALAEAKDNWTIDRHEHYPTNDVLLHDIGLNEIYNKVLDEVVRPLAIHLWNLEGNQWEAFSTENFMARYTTTRQSHLSLHHDRSHLTMVVKLNDEFSGGGTWFPQYQKLSNPKEVGTAVLHPGMITHRHGARPITLGKRYIAVSFIRSHDEP